jgi:hypothetical protein
MECQPGDDRSTNRGQCSRIANWPSPGRRATFRCTTAGIVSIILGSTAFVMGENRQFLYLAGRR